MKFWKFVTFWILTGKCLGGVVRPSERKQEQRERQKSPEKHFWESHAKFGAGSTPSTGVGETFLRELILLHHSLSVSSFDSPRAPAFVCRSHRASWDVSHQDSGSFEFSKIFSKIRTAFSWFSSMLLGEKILYATQILEIDSNDQEKGFGSYRILDHVRTFHPRSSCPQRNTYDWTKIHCRHEV